MRKVNEVFTVSHSYTATSVTLPMTDLSFSFEPPVELKKGQVYRIVIDEGVASLTEVVGARAAPAS